ncbi:unnamed protein product, partial [Prorocentrum cordatum]
DCQKLIWNYKLIANDRFYQCGHKVQLWEPWSSAKLFGRPDTSTSDKQMRNLLQAAGVPPGVAEAIKATQRAAAATLRTLGELETATEAHEEKIAEQVVAETAHRLAPHTLQREQARDTPQALGNKIVIGYGIFETADPDDMEEAERNTFKQYKLKFDAARPQLETAAQKSQDLMASIKGFDMERAAKRRRGHGGAAGHKEAPAGTGAGSGAESSDA